jgi:predicted enzyme related to lactoylglutathione lyase
MTSPTAHFEIHAADLARAKAVDAGLFGWDYQDVPDLGIEHRMVLTDGIGPGKPLTGAIPRPDGPTPEPGQPPRRAMWTFTVADVDAAYARALATGGAEALPPADYPHAGRVAYFADSAGNIVGTIQPAGGN